MTRLDPLSQRLFSAQHSLRFTSHTRKYHPSYAITRHASSNHSTPSLSIGSLRSAPFATSFICPSRLAAELITSAYSTLATRSTQARQLLHLLLFLRHSHCPSR